MQQHCIIRIYTGKQLIGWNKKAANSHLVAWFTWMYVLYLSSEEHWMLICHRTYFQKLWSVIWMNNKDVSMNYYFITIYFIPYDITILKNISDFGDKYKPQSILLRQERIWLSRNVCKWNFRHLKLCRHSLSMVVAHLV